LISFAWCFGSVKLLLDYSESCKGPSLYAELTAWSSYVTQSAC